MPILAGDRLIGRIHLRRDRSKQVLHIKLLQIEPGIQLDPTFIQQLHEAIYHFGYAHGAKKITVEKTGTSKY